MSLISPSEPKFFGKDEFTTFFGQIESVDDPKRSNRVKVRALGFYSEEKIGEDGVTTTDLPWAKVSMPATHSQQMGVGGKHGFQPGDWVWGFFLDGRAAQKPMVVGSWGFTAKASEENNRINESSVDGTIPENVKPFSKVNPLYDVTFPNKGLVSSDDSGDIAYDTVKDDSGDGHCPIKRSVQTDQRESQKNSQSNAEGQEYDTLIPDGICSSVIGARDEINRIMREQFPIAGSRFTYGDLVWDIVTGNRIDLNGILSRISILICDIIKQSIQTQKALQERLLNRTQMSALEGVVADRDGIRIQIVDQTIDVQQDTWHVAFAKLLDVLCSEVLKLLQGINNQEESPTGQNNTGIKGSKSRTQVADGASLCVTDTILNNIALLLEKTLEEANNAKDNNLMASMESIQQATELINNLDPDDFRCNEDVNEEVEKMIDMVKQDQPATEAISDSFGLSDISQYITIMIDLKFTLLPEIFSKIGIATLDPLSKDGCKPSRLYSTVNNALGSIAGITDQINGAGSDSGRSSKNSKDVYKNIGFGGKPGETEQNFTTTVCDDALINKTKDGDRQRTLNSLSFWTPVDFHDPIRRYELQGEVEFDGIRTNNSRVLVSNQINKSENGIYVTSNLEWIRSSDANESKEFTKNKLVSVRNVPAVDEFWVYTGDDRPRLDSTSIIFTRLFYSKIDFGGGGTGTTGGSGTTGGTGTNTPDVPTSGRGVRPNIPEGVGSPGGDTTNRLLISEGIPEEIGIALNPFVESVPSGFNGKAIALSLPSGDPDAAENFISGIPNVVCIIEPGQDYFFTRPDKPECGFPSIYIPDYFGTPTPVVDPSTGEFVAILTLPQAFGMLPSPRVSLIPDKSCLGIRSDDENYDIVVGGIYISNTGFNYSEDVVVELYDRDRKVLNGEAKCVVIEGRIVEIQLINNGSGYKRIPEVRIKDNSGFGARLYPIMNVVQRVPGDIGVKPIPEAVKVSYCPGKNQFNNHQPTSL